ncbi:hypothetical protein A2V56_00305 [Candidatus Woesebacteria bacterium RBG_19FT_COMBO_42_9]|uniref:Nudix hydrolase domain-containing protein n=1 Tax=Candidatus Woesebacteria bacterium RBG_16_42_24 TaxID=1802485 RepID=A0A1F7XLD0_9BACT|nr:MAG: hypothetical protein A2V97_00310 [Candidatus Woesebacteria bacterium RBG_16_42_24]OGM17447.1 MAG: hypothetical protein A2V56_00305 [Candidatus Woesebacteria bacterium RBG_19FT_COMBO_42_9]OGM67856.1 MAG: hypothetical protein A2985_00285 [Candidatus Woesebacteria bacterium RIFCSPLOWO2_01_FULL_43_11]
MEDEEYLDIVDRNDKVVGRDTRNNIWKRGLEHNVRVVNIFVLNAENKILLPTRSMKKKIFPGCYDFSCGEHVRSGESYLEAAKRGLNEELSIKEAKIQELGKMTPKDGVGCFAMVYRVDIADDIGEFNKQEIDKLEWLDVVTITAMAKAHPENFKRGILETITKFSALLRKIH